MSSPLDDVVYAPSDCPDGLMNWTDHPDMGPSSTIPRAETGILSSTTGQVEESTASDPHPQAVMSQAAVMADTRDFFIEK